MYLNSYNVPSNPEPNNHGSCFLEPSFAPVCPLDEWRDSPLPVSLNPGSLVVSWSGLFSVLQADFGLWLSTDLTYSLTLTLPHPSEGHPCGLCGNFSRDRSDDAEACATSETESRACGAACGAAGPGCEDQGQIVWARGRCRLLQDPPGPLRLLPQRDRPSCVGDVCLARGSERILCLALQTCAAACQGANVTIGSWRSRSFWAATCAQHSRYQLRLTPAARASAPPPAAPAQGPRLRRGLSLQRRAPGVQGQVRARGAVHGMHGGRS
ncbi:IgGFc-binding protein-like [Choloepus didactylus]|uniref:IgGFc-binding protein-like n=1 Tax=Choloepus didactylus TaxID=27675 RepID=UPI00189C873D|nr:IgGFc-binding protein-like [Choloepus didactylus]